MYRSRGSICSTGRHFDWDMSFGKLPERKTRIFYLNLELGILSKTMANEPVKNEANKP